MSVLVLQLFVSLALVAFGVALLIVSIRQGDPDHADRLSLTPLEDDLPARSKKER